MQDVSTGRLFSGVKRPQREAYNSPLFSVEVETGQVYASHKRFTWFPIKYNENIFALQHSY